MNRKKTAIVEIKFIRVICTLGIVMFHFYCHSSSEVKLFYSTANYVWSTVLVTIFFAISGAVMRYNYPEVQNLNYFYYRRWKSIFPAFYTCFIYFFIQYVFASKNVFYGGNPSKLLLTLLGMDGYFLYRIPNYYINVGEWFLGAIIMLYLLYPFVSSVYNKMPLIGFLLLISGYTFVLKSTFFIIPTFRNLIICLVSFCFGMIAIHHQEVLTNKSVFATSLLISIIGTAIPLGIDDPLKQIVFSQVFGFLIFIVLYNIGSMVMSKRMENKLITELDNISYEIFLFQHVIILKFLGFRNPSDTWIALVWAITILLYIIICAKILSVVVREMEKSRLAKGFERMILTKT